MDRAMEYLSLRAAACLIPAVILVSSTSCTRTLSQAQIKFLETRELRSPYSQVYNGALNAIFSLGMTINHSDKTSGVITGQTGDYAHRAGMSAWQRRKHPVKKVTLLITSRGPTTTQIRMKVLVNEEQQLDRTLMTKLWQRIAREAMLDSGPRRRQASARRHRE